MRRDPDRHEARIAQTALLLLMMIGRGMAQASGQEHPASAFVLGQNAFAIGLLKASRPADPGSNAVAAPHGVAGLLAITREGASGRTASEIDGALGLDPNGDRATLFEAVDPSRCTFRPALGAELRSNGGYGVKLAAVGAGSAADRAGLKPGDLILALDARPSRTRPALEAAIAQGPGRGRLQVFAVESGQVSEVEMTFDREANPDSAVVESARGIWTQTGSPVPSAFRSVAEGRFRATIAAVDFRDDPPGALRTINAWLASTAGQGRAALLGEPDLGPDARLVLLDHFGFRGRWLSPFPPATPGPFRAQGGPVGDVPMMRQVGRFPMDGSGRFDILELPYTGGDFAMLVILPREPSTADGLLDSLTATELAQAVARLRPSRVDVVLPRFLVRRQLRLEPSLAAIGISRAFGDDAEFPGIDPDHPIKLAAIRQDVEVEVDEAGTRAVATTSASGVLIKGDEADPVRFHADRPFLFFLVDRRSSLIVVEGVVRKP